MLRLFLGEGEDILHLEFLVDEQGFLKARRIPGEEWEELVSETRILGYIAKNSPVLNVRLYLNDVLRPQAGLYPIIASPQGVEVSEYHIHFFEKNYDPNKDFEGQ